MTTRLGVRCLRRRLADDAGKLFILSLLHLYFSEVQLLGLAGPVAGDKSCGEDDDGEEDVVEHSVSSFFASTNALFHTGSVRLLAIHSLTFSGFPSSSTDAARRASFRVFTGIHPRTAFRADPNPVWASTMTVATQTTAMAMYVSMVIHAGVLSCTLATSVLILVAKASIRDALLTTSGSLVSRPCSMRAWASVRMSPEEDEIRCVELHPATNTRQMMAIRISRQTW